MGAKLLKKDQEIVSAKPATSSNPASAAVIMESMVATMAELEALRADSGYFGAPKKRPSASGR